MTEAGDDVPLGVEALRAELASFAQPFPSSTPAHTFVRNLQYAVLSQLRGRRRWRALLWREPADRRIARAVLADRGDASEWETAHPLLGL